jgi:hypothetical protein
MVNCLGGGINCLLVGFAEDVAGALEISVAQDNEKVEDVHWGVNHDFGVARHND